MPVINDIAVSPEHFIYRNVNKFEKYKYTIKMWICFAQTVNFCVIQESCVLYNCISFNTEMK